MPSETFSITGMSCGACVAKVKKHLEAIESVTLVEVSLQPPIASVQSPNNIGLETVNKAVSELGPGYSAGELPDDWFALSDWANVSESQSNEKESSFDLRRYWPLILIVLFLVGGSLMLSREDGFAGFMRMFMGGFFLVFSFFKLLDLSGFAKSFRMYDVLAKRLVIYAFSYPFIELALGCFYLLGLFPPVTNTITILIMGMGLIGVIKAVFDKTEIQCACLGTVFDLPMSSVTIIENSVMILMAFTMLIIG